MIASIRWYLGSFCLGTSSPPSKAKPRHAPVLKNSISDGGSTAHKLLTPLTLFKLTFCKCKHSLHYLHSDRYANIYCGLRPSKKLHIIGLRWHLKFRNLNFWKQTCLSEWWWLQQTWLSVWCPSPLSLFLAAVMTTWRYITIIQLYGNIILDKHKSVFIHKMFFIVLGH